MKYPSVFGVKNVKSLSRIWGQNNRIKIAEIAVAGAPNDDFRKNICSEDDFRIICCKISCLPASPMIFEHQKNGIIAYF